MKLDLIKNHKVIAHFQKEHITSKEFISLLKMGYDIRLSDNLIDKDQAALATKPKAANIAPDINSDTNSDNQNNNLYMPGQLVPAKELIIDGKRVLVPITEDINSDTTSNPTLFRIQDQNGTIHANNVKPWSEACKIKDNLTSYYAGSNLNFCIIANQ